MRDSPSDSPGRCLCDDRSCFIGRGGCNACCVIVNLERLVAINTGSDFDHNSSIAVSIQTITYCNPQLDGRVLGEMENRSGGEDMRNAVSPLGAGIPQGSLRYFDEESSATPFSSFA